MCAVSRSVYHDGNHLMNNYITTKVVRDVIVVTTRNEDAPCECLIEVGFDIEDAFWVRTVRIQREDGAECDVTCRLRAVPI